GAGRTRQAPVAHRTRLPGAQAGTGAWARRGPRLARLPPSRHALHRSLWLPDRRTGENSPLRICRPEAHSHWPSHGLSTPRRLRSDRSGTSRTQSPPCAGGSPWLWPKASSDVRAAQRTSAGLRTIPARDAVVLPTRIQQSLEAAPEHPLPVERHVIHFQPRVAHHLRVGFVAHRL